MGCYGQIIGLIFIICLLLGEAEAIRVRRTRPLVKRGGLTLRGRRTKPLVNHGGQTLRGNIQVSLVFYGHLGKVQKNTLRAFLKSLNHNAKTRTGPKVSSWWNMVSSYQAGRRPRPIKVKVVRQYVDPHYSYGKIMTADFIEPLAKKAIVGLPRAIPIIVVARDVSVMGLCMGKCAKHGLVNRTPYVIIGNPENECPGACAWPFHKADYGPRGPVLKPPSGNVGADAMVMNLASGLASLVTNPFNNGYYRFGKRSVMIEAGDACPRMFGKGATRRYTGKVFVDRRNGGAYNAIGFKGKKFLLPALWNPRTKSCWTVI